MLKYKFNSRVSIVLLASVMAGCAFTTSVVLADWKVIPGLFIQQIYTDNVDLDKEKESESVTRISPRVSAYNKGARASVDLNYAPQYLYYWEGNESNELVHFLRAAGDMELYRDHFFVNGWATASQQATTSDARTGVDGISGSDELTEVYTLGINPYLTGRLARAAEFKTSYQLDKLYYSDNDEDDSTSQSVNLAINSLPSTMALSWGMSVFRQVVDFDNQEDDDKTKSVQGELAYQLTNAWSLTADLGYEDFELSNQEDQSGNTWHVGVIFTPNSRTRIAAGGGERAFGNDYYLDFSHRSRRTIWTATYDRDFLSSRDEISDPGLFPRLDEFGDEVEDPASENPENQSSTGPTLNSDQYVLERFSTAFTLASARTDITLGADHTERKYEQSVQDTKDVGLSVGLTRQIGQSTSGVLGGGWIDHDEASADYEEWRVSVGGGYQLGPHSAINLDLAHLKRDAQNDNESYEENRASLGLSLSW